MTRKILIAASALLATSTLAGASDYGYGGSAQREIDARQAQQERRIQQGVRSGEVSRSEYSRLENEQARIRDLERQAKADGHISRAEAARIREAQNQASRHIYQEKHDGERRRGWWRWY